MNGIIRIVQGDITELHVDAIVNAANKQLRGGGGVDGAIHRAAGQTELQQACRKIGHCDTGQAVITSGFHLPARYIIHTVGPVWHGGAAKEDELLAACYRNCLTLAVNHGIRSIAFPCVSTGVYGFPHDRARDIALNEVRRFLNENDSICEVVLCCFNRSSAESYRQALAADQSD